MDVRRQKRERDSDLSSSPLQDTTMFGGDSDSSKKAKTDGSGGASRVVHIRNIVTGVSETEVIQLCMPLGTITNLLMMKQKNQAFVEFEKENAASVMINYFSRSAQPMLGGRPVFVQYSQHKELKTDAAHAIANEKAPAALQACQNGSAGIMEGSNGEGFGVGVGGASTGQEAVLHVTIENMVYPVTLETLAIIFKKYGPVQKILTFTKNNKFQALIQYPNHRCAEDARFALHGQNVYNGCCNLRVESSKVTSVNVKFNNERAWDFTNPNLPAGDGNMRGNSSGGSMGGGGVMGNGGQGMMGAGMGMGNGHSMGGGMGGGGMGGGMGSGMG